MVLQRNGSDRLPSFERVDTYIPSVLLYPRESTNSSTNPYVNSEGKMSESVQVKGGGTESHDDTSTRENMLLRKKIQNIEMQNQSQQQRLHQLEKLVLELQGFITLTSTPAKHPLHQSAVECSPNENVCNSGIDTDNNQSKPNVEELKDPCEMEDSNLLTVTEEGRDSSEVGSQDMASLMDEFDRKARENGLVYGMTPCHSIAESDDLAETSKLLTSSPDTLFSSVSESPDEIVCSAPSPAFITPMYQTNTENLNPLYREPETTPQLSFTTPSLLTVEALKDVEAQHQHTKSSDECPNNLHPFVGNTLNEPSVSLVKNHLADRGSPFSNLIAGIRQMPAPQSKKSITGKSFWPVKSAQYRSSEQKGSGMCSPAGSVGSTSEAILRWSQSLRLPFLSPLTESHCSDQPLASEDEELVVDEVVSQSVARPVDGGQQRQRSESFAAITGPCVPTDLFFDTSGAEDEAGVSHGKMKEEQISTEIADVDGSFLIEETMLPKDLSSVFTYETAIVEGEENPTNKGDEQILSVENCEEENTRENEDEKPSQTVSEGELKLPAGSLVLAMVNEAGSLVPYVDVETVSEKNPVLEAGDVDSLLAQFEATEAVNKPGYITIKEENEKKSEKSKLGSEEAKSLSSVTKIPSTCRSQRDSSSGCYSQVSPTHQNIKDALPQEVIEKIKASNKRKSTQMLPAPLAVHKGRVVKKQETTTQRSTAHCSTSRNRKKEKKERLGKLHIPPPVDHDYCGSTDKQKKSKCDGKCHDTKTTLNNSISISSTSTVNDMDIYNKLPDYYKVISKQSAKKSDIVAFDGNDDGGKKDSGVESGDVSDASVETEERRKKRKDTNNSPSQGAAVVMSIKAEEEDIYNKLPAYMTDIGNAKPKEEPADNEETNAEHSRENESSSSTKVPELKKIKRKLNLSEYRQRIQSTQSSRCASPIASHLADSTTSLKVAELVQKMESSKVKQEDDEKSTESKEVEVEQVDEDIEEGELKGDTDPEDEQPKPVEENQGNSDSHNQNLPVSGMSKSENVATKNPTGYQGLTSGSMSSNPEARGGTTAASPWQYSPQRTKSRRWSSSSRSRSRTRSPKHSTSRRHRSSWGRRRRKGRSSQSPRRSSWRRWSRSRSRSRSHSRSRSRSLSSSCSSTFASRSGSRSRSRSSRRRDRWNYTRRRSSHDRRRSRSGSRSSWYSSSRVTRSRSPIWPLHSRPQLPRHSRLGVNEDRTRQVEERRVIYIGRISDGTTKAELRHRFERYGTIVDISVHFREHGDNYGFVTYKNREEAYSAVEHGNDDPTLPKYDLCFGGRRAFCRVQYSDLDAQNVEGDYHGGGGVGAGSLDFDSLLRAAMKRNTR